MESEEGSDSEHNAIEHEFVYVFTFQTVERKKQRKRDKKVAMGISSSSSPIPHLIWKEGTWKVRHNMNDTNVSHQI